MEQNNERVMVRMPQTSGDALMKNASVMSRSGAIVRVVLDGEHNVREISASDILPLQDRGGYGRGAQQHTAKPVQSFPTSSSSIGNMLSR